MKRVPCRICPWSVGGPIPDIKESDDRSAMKYGSASERAQEPFNEGGCSFSTNRRGETFVGAGSRAPAWPILGVRIGLVVSFCTLNYRARVRHTLMHYLGCM